MVGGEEMEAYGISGNGRYLCLVDGMTKSNNYYDLKGGPAPVRNFVSSKIRAQSSASTWTTQTQGMGLTPRECRDLPDGLAS
jgi:hypothetical protein